MSVINPESDVWQHIKIPQSYLATNWPIKYSSISSDGRLIAVAGRRGLIHYSSTSGRWKQFSDERQEQAFAIKGGLLWFHHVLIAAVEVPGAYQVSHWSPAFRYALTVWLVTIIFSRFGAQQPECIAPGNSQYFGRHSLHCG
jgi:hypothetical protein